jgi:uncharacterized protein with FMN-binding domain
MRTGATSSFNAMMRAINEVLDRHNFVAGAPPEIEIPDNPLFAEFDRNSQFSASAIGWAREGRTGGFGPGDENIYVYVVMSADNSRIQEVLVNFNLETLSFVERLHPSLFDEIVSRQTTHGIDVYTGATASAQAVLEAVNTVLARIGFEHGPTDEVDPGYEVTPGDDDDDDDDENGGDEGAQQPPAGGEQPPTAGGDEQPPAPAARFAAGTVNITTSLTYANLDGNEGGLPRADMTVAITFDDNVVTAINIVSHGETQDYLDHALNQMRNRLVGQHSTAGISDTVSGATYTARGIHDAVTRAIAQASN